MALLAGTSGSTVTRRATTNGATVSLPRVPGGLRGRDGAGSAAGYAAGRATATPKATATARPTRSEARP